MNYASSYSQSEYGSMCHRVTLQLVMALSSELAAVTEKLKIGISQGYPKGVAMGVTRSSAVLPAAVIL